MVLSAELYLRIRKVRKQYKGGKSNRSVAIYTKIILWIRKSFVPYMKSKWSKSESNKVKHWEMMESYEKVREGRGGSIGFLKGKGRVAEGGVPPHGV